MTLASESLPLSGLKILSVEIMEPVLIVPNICLPLGRMSSKLKIQPKGEILPGPPVQIPWARKTACISNLLIKESAHDYDLLPSPFYPFGISRTLPLRSA